MSAPFHVVCMSRKDQVERCAEETLKRLDQWRAMSSDKKVTLDEVAWLAALLIKAGLEPLHKANLEKREEGNVVSVVAGSGTTVKDGFSK